MHNDCVILSDQREPKNLSRKIAVLRRDFPCALNDIVFYPLKSVACIHQAGKGVVCLFVGKKGGKLLFHSQRFQA